MRGYHTQSQRKTSNVSPEFPRSPPYHLSEDREMRGCDIESSARIPTALARAGSEKVLPLMLTEPAFSTLLATLLARAVDQ